MIKQCDERQALWVRVQALPVDKWRGVQGDVFARVFGWLQDRDTEAAEKFFKTVEMAVKEWEAR